MELVYEAENYWVVLNQLDIKAPGGGIWSPSKVYRIVYNRCYTGKHTYNSKMRIPNPKSPLGNVTGAVLDASTTYEDRVRESHVPLTLTPEAAQLLVDQGVQVKDQISVFATLRFAREYDDRYEVERTTKCEVLVEELSLIAKGVGSGNTSGYIL